MNLTNINHNPVSMHPPDQTIIVIVDQNRIVSHADRKTEVKVIDSPAKNHSEQSQQCWQNAK